MKYIYLLLFEYKATESYSFDKFLALFIDHKGPYQGMVVKTT